MFVFINNGRGSDSGKILARESKTDYFSRQEPSRSLPQAIAVCVHCAFGEDVAACRARVGKDRDVEQKHEA